MFAKTCRRNLLALAAAYGRAKGIGLKTVSRAAYGNPDFFGKLKSNEISVSIRKTEDLLAWFRKHWPDGTQWPCLPPLFMNREP